MALPPVALFAVALALRLAQHHDALLYPDGYQYLLMARGIAEHFEPTTVLGPGGDTFVPSPDAAAKPVYPLVVAGVHVFGVSWLTAGSLVTAAAAAAVVVLAALLAAKVGRSPWAGAAAGVLLLASPSLGFWSGFSGPDPLAQALALAAALAFVNRRPVAGGALAGLAIATRPELALVALAAAAVAWRSGDWRSDLRRAAPATVITPALVYGTLRPPVALPDVKLVVIAVVALCCLLVVALAPAALARYAVMTALGVATVVVVGSSGVAELWRHDWPLLAVAAAGLVVLAWNERGRSAAAVLVGCALLLGTVYAIKNPALERYFALLLPCAALLVGIAVARAPSRARPLALGVIALAVAAGFLRPIPGSRDYDAFAAIASRVDTSLPSSAALVTAAPDAYGFLLPRHAVRDMRPGVRGAILLDPAQRLYAPSLGAKGRVVLRVTDEVAFARPDGELDAAPAVIVAGDVVRARPGRERPGG